MTKRVHLTPEQRDEIVDHICDRLAPEMSKIVAGLMEANITKNFLFAEDVEVELNRYIHRAIDSAYHALTPRWFAKLFFRNRYVDESTT